MKSIAYLGPEGTFSEAALIQVLGDSATKIKMVPKASLAEVIEAVDRGECGLGFVPIENSLEGSVNITVDMLAFHADLLIVGESVMEIRQNLIARKGTRLEDIKSVYSLPMAIDQCLDFLSKRLPHARMVTSDSTADAVKAVSETDETNAAIGTSLAAGIYGLEVIESDIQSGDENETRFVFLGKNGARKSGEDKTSIVCSIYQDRPGSLLQILQEFAYRYINLTKIESRPAKKGLGDYVFFIDMEGHVDDEIVQEAIKCLKCKVKGVKIIGSYPKAGSAHLLQEVLTQLL